MSALLLYSRPTFPTSGTNFFKCKEYGAYFVCACTQRGSEQNNTCRNIFLKGIVYWLIYCNVLIRMIIQIVNAICANDYLQNISTYQQLIKVLKMYWYIHRQ